MHQKFKKQNMRSRLSNFCCIILTFTNLGHENSDKSIEPLIEIAAIGESKSLEKEYSNG